MGVGRQARKAIPLAPRPPAGPASPADCPCRRPVKPGMIPPMQTRLERIHAALEAAFPAARIAVADDSRHHAGHAGASPAGETHYSVQVVAAAFAGIGRLARSRRVHEVLAPEFGSGLHALSLKLLTPEEAGRG